MTRPRLPNIPTLTTATLLLVLAAPPLIGTAVTFHAVSILGSRDIEYLAAGGVIGLLGATSAVGVLIAGALVDRLSTRSSLLLPTLAVLVGSLALLVPATWTAYTAFAVLGLGMGSVGVVNGTVWARTFGTAQLGHIQGIAQSSMITAAAVAPLIPALSLSLTSSHQPGIITLALVAAAATLLARYGRVGGERSIPATGASPA